MAAILKALRKSELPCHCLLFLHELAIHYTMNICFAITLIVRHCP
jgi:hypothetical protein